MFPEFPPKKFAIDPPSDPEIRKKFEEEKAELDENQVKWSDASASHPLPENPVHDNYPQRLDEETVRYYGFDYCPEDPDNMETLSPEEIPKLFLVKLNASPHWHPIKSYYIEILRKLGLNPPKSLKASLNWQINLWGDAPPRLFAVCKNIPEVNRLLYNVKHLVEITPIKLPQNLDLNADPADCFLTDEGEFIHNPSLRVSEERMSPADVAYPTEHSIHRHLYANHRFAWKIKPCS